MAQHDDEEALTEAVATHRRAENALEQFRKHGAKRALGFPFSTAIWNAGFVKRPGHIFLLTTLDKAGHGSDFQYQDHFISRTEFQWQSQNRTSQESSDGQDIKHHAERQIGVHLFVRQQKRRVGGPGAAPFVYCGDVSFVDWSGERPITVRWRLPIEVPDQVWSTLAT